LNRQAKATKIEGSWNAWGLTMGVFRQAILVVTIWFKALVACWVVASARQSGTEFRLTALE